MSREYKTIEAFYGGRVAARSLVPLINHIDEGTELLSNWNRPMLEINAFCIHPIVQNDEDIDVTWSESYNLALEYKIKANSYLCRPDTDWIKQRLDVRLQVGSMSESCMWLLLADKVQNQKDFRKYHWFEHPRAEQLENYFNMWIMYLKAHLSR